MSLTKLVNGQPVAMSPEEESAILAERTAAAAEVHVPHSVTMRQARLALLQAGMLDSVESAINAMSEPQKTAARITWDYSSEVLRTNPLVAALTPALGLSSSDVDDLFIAAAAL